MTAQVEALSKRLLWYGMDRKYETSVEISALMKFAVIPVRYVL
jgi:hypothetical protein